MVATQNNTVVTVIPSKPIFGHETDSVIRVKLNAGETYSFKKPAAVAADNLVGTIVTSTKPIAISIKDDSVIKETCRDALGDQLIPANVAGREYIVPRGFLRVRNTFLLWRRKTIQMFILRASIVPVITLEYGTIYTDRIILHAIYIRATKPILLSSCYRIWMRGGYGVLPPINCTGSKRISFTRSTDEFFGMNILSRKEGIIRFQAHSTMVNRNSCLRTCSLKSREQMVNGMQVFCTFDDSEVSCAESEYNFK